MRTAARRILISGAPLPTMVKRPPMNKVDPCSAMELTVPSGCGFHGLGSPVVASTAISRARPVGAPL